MTKQFSIAAIQREGCNLYSKISIDYTEALAGAVIKAPPRADVVKSLKNGIIVNLLEMGAAILGMQATVGLLVAKTLTTSATPFYQGVALATALFLPWMYSWCRHQLIQSSHTFSGLLPPWSCCVLSLYPLRNLLPCLRLLDPLHAS